MHELLITLRDVLAHGAHNVEELYEEPRLADYTRVDIRGALRKLSDEGVIEVTPQGWRVVPKTLADVVRTLAESDIPVRGVGKVYAFIFGVPPEKREWGIIGKLVQAVGPRTAANMLLSYAAHGLPEGGLATVLAIALSRNAPPPRPDDAPSVADQLHEARQRNRAWRIASRAKWEARGCTRREEAEQWARSAITDGPTLAAAMRDIRYIFQDEEEDK